MVLTFPILASGQKDTVFFFGPNGTLEPGANKILKKEIRQQNNKRVRITTWKIDQTQELLLFTERVRIKKPDIHNIRIKGREFSEKIRRVFEKQPDGLFHFTDWQNEQVKRTGSTLSKIPLLFHGEVIEYYESGIKKSESLYKHNELVSNTNWNEEGKEYINNIFYSVEQEPLFKSGTDFLHRHVLHIFDESGIDLTQVEGRIVVGFVVMENGSIEGLRIEKGLGQDLNNLALQALNTLPGEWQPAKLNGEKVRYYQLFPINFIYRKFDFDYLELKGNMLYWEIN